jgi:hypothetical protein
VPAPWNKFNGAALQNTNDLYFFEPGQYVQAKEGTNVVQVYNNGEYNGVYQEAPASPGQIFTGDCWLWLSSYDQLYAPTNQAFLEVQFWAANGGAPIAIYQSSKVTNASPQNTWLYLQATNGVAAGYASTTTTNAYYLVAPAGTGKVRFQISLNQEGAGAGSVYVDVMQLMKKIPVTLTTTSSGGSITISWQSQGATDYQVVYKNSVTDTSWIPIETVSGDGTVKSVSYAEDGSGKIYSVLTK